jgi:hypothetical protein
MTAPGSHRARWLWVAAAACVLVPALVVACGEDESATPECPDLPLFNVREVEGDAASDAAKAALEEWKDEGARDEGCVTAPGTAVVPEAGD